MVASLLLSSLDFPAAAAAAAADVVAVVVALVVSLLPNPKRFHSVDMMEYPVRARSSRSIPMDVVVIEAPSGVVVTAACCSVVMVSCFSVCVCERERESAMVPNAMVDDR